MSASRQARSSNDADTLALGDKELLLNKKMEEMKLKNEETMRKYKVIERDKLVAEKLGRAVQVAKHGPAPPMKSPKRTEEPSSVSSVGTNQPDRRHTQGSSNGSDHQGRKYNSNKKLEAMSEPPPDPVYHFLADRRHINGQQTEVQEKKNSGFKRHPRNYGGNTFESVPQLIEVETGRSGYCRPVPQTKMEYIICTTGRERHVREEWKKEREKVDQERIDRQKNEHGDWKREWDHEKINQEFNDYPPIVDMSVFSRRMETGNRSGKIGSGRFTGDHAISRSNMSTRQGDDDTSYTSEYDERQDLPHGRGRGIERGETRVPGRGQWRNQGMRGRGRGQRRPVSKTRQNPFVNNHPGIDRRSVEYQNNTLLMKVENRESTDAKPLPETRSPTESRDYTDPRMQTELKHPTNTGLTNKLRNPEEIERPTDARQQNKPRYPDDRIQLDMKQSEQSDKTRRPIDNKQSDHQPIPERRPINDVRQLPQSYNEYSNAARRGNGGFRRFDDVSANNSQRKEQWNRFMSGSHSSSYEHSKGRGRQQPSSNRFFGAGRRPNQRQNFEKNKFASKDNNRSNEPNENVSSNSCIANKRNVDRSSNEVNEHIDKRRGVSFRLDELVDKNHPSDDTENSVTINRSVSIQSGTTLTSNEKINASIGKDAKSSQVKPREQRFTHDNRRLRPRNQMSKPVKEKEQNKKMSKPLKENESSEKHADDLLLSLSKQEQTPTHNNTTREKPIKDKIVEENSEIICQVETNLNEPKDQTGPCEEQIMNTDCLQRLNGEEHDVIKTAENYNHHIVAELEIHHVRGDPANNSQCDAKIMQSDNINELKSVEIGRSPIESSNLCNNGESDSHLNSEKLMPNKNIKGKKVKPAVMRFNRKTCEKVIPEKSAAKSKEKADDDDDDSWEDVDESWEDVDESIELYDQSSVSERESNIIINNLNIALVEINTDTSISQSTQLT